MENNYKPFALNFNDDKKIVSVTLPEKESIFQLAHAFSKWLTENGIKNEITEQPIIQPESLDDEQPIPVQEN